MNLGYIAIGCAVGWFSPILPLFQSANTPLILVGPMSNYDAGWIAAHFETGSVCGVILFGIIAHRFGNKISITLSIIPVFVSIADISQKNIGSNIFFIQLSWPIVIFAKFIWHIGLSKFFGGLSFGGYTICTTLFVVEICDDK